MHSAKAIGAALCAAALLSGCGGSGAAHWQDLRRVSVTVAQPGIAPPGGLPRTTTFVTPTDLQRVTALLNAHHISRAHSTSSNPACAGGDTIIIAITPQHGAPVRLSAYRCANQTTGDIGGDLVGFLSALGYSV